ncbi:MAG: hypothetical protein M1820_006401 [Bogoriella megaspora]|nr:MAG: hypothetical protein M1820_006401 [Bogoriella megaspora]
MGFFNRFTHEAKPPTESISPVPSDTKATDMDKGVTTQIESTVSKSSPFSSTDIDVAANLFTSRHELDAPIDPAVEKKLIRKIDWMILPYLAVCYAFFYIDKTTLSYAAIFGIKTDLHLVGTDYNWLSSIFYFGFLAWAIPTNFGLQRFRSFASLAALRALSGAAEACSDPAFMLITSMWYTRRQQPVRMGLWYTANGFGIALGGLLGYGIGHIRGALASWRYEFLIIGALCTVWGIVMMIMLPDSPVSAKRLSLEERKIAVERLKGNQTGIENKHFKMYQLKEALLDPKTYLFFLLGTVCNEPNGVISNFGTLIIQGPFFCKTDQAPSYPLGIWSMIVCHLIEAGLVCTFYVTLSLENKRRDRLYGKVQEKDIDETAFGDLTDRENKNFRYVF